MIIPSICPWNDSFAKEVLKSQSNRMPPNQTNHDLITKETELNNLAYTYNPLNQDTPTYQTHYIKHV